MYRHGLPHLTIANVFPTPFPLSASLLEFGIKDPQILLFEPLHSFSPLFQLHSESKRLHGKHMLMKTSAVAVYRVVFSLVRPKNDLSVRQRPKKSELSGGQLSTRKNFPDEVRKSFSRQKKCA